jgi:uncharacterized membrane protein
MASHPLANLAQSLLGKQVHELEIEEHNVLTKITNNLPISRDVADVADERSTFGQRLADRVAAVGGSWGFIITFFVLLVGWMLLNTDILAHWNMAFDPYPYIFLNLMLSMLAAIQAPVIMMSQNRQAVKDRISASLDYEVNLRAELDVLRLHEKIDQLVAQRIDIMIGKQDELLARSNRAAS